MALLWHSVHSVCLYVCVSKRVRSVLSNEMNQSVCDLDVEHYILSAIFIVLSFSHTYTQQTVLSELIDSILNHITSITNCFMFTVHLSACRGAVMCVSV